MNLAKRMDLFKGYLENAKLLPPTLYRLIQEDGLAHLHICDYIAGMTDRYALMEHARLFDPNQTA